MSETVEFTPGDAMAVLRNEMLREGVEPGSYAHAWYCNIKMSMYDELERFTHKAVLTHDEKQLICHRAANQMMKSAFGVEIVETE